MIVGGKGADTIFAGLGVDSIVSGAGNDTINIGAAGNIDNINFADTLISGDSGTVAAVTASVGTDVFAGVFTRLSSKPHADVPSPTENIQHHIAG